MFYMDRLSGALRIYSDKFRNISQLYCKHLNYLSNVVIVSSHYWAFCQTKLLENQRQEGSKFNQKYLERGHESCYTHTHTRRSEKKE